MKICWDNLEKLRYSPNTGKWYKGQHTYIYKENCKNCEEQFLGISHEKFCSKSCMQSGKNNNFRFYNKEVNDNRDKHSQWKGGYTIKNLTKYDDYFNRLSYAEEIRRNKEDKNILEVKCAYCGKWYVPTLNSVWNRIQALEGKYEGRGESRLYCSDICKQECPIYKKIKYPKGYKIASSREVQAELRQLRFELDNYTCQKCNKHKDDLKVGLHCHHVEGIRWEPLESADIDKCITYCKDCHKKVHKISDCNYNSLKCKEKTNGTFALLAIHS